MTSFTISELVPAIQSKELSARQAVEQSIRAIESLNPEINAFISADVDYAMLRAGTIDESMARGETIGPLAGVPVAVKDNMCTTFGRTTCASRILPEFRSPYNAGAVERLEAAGAVVLGKCNMDEFAMGGSTEHSAAGPTKNPWDESRVAGGSSGGSAAAVAARIVPAALGSDTGGSIRQPASFCGVVGLKPTYGRVSRYGLVAFASSLDQIGPFTTSVKDTAIMLHAIAGHDSRDSTSADQLVPNYAASLDRDIKGMRIGVATEYFGPGLSEDVRTAVESAIEVYRQAGAEIVEIHLPHMKYAIACYYIVATAEASSNLARYDGVHFGHRNTNANDIIDLYANSRSDGFGPEVKRRIMLGTYALSSGYYDAYYVKALKVRTLIKRDFDNAFEKVDAIASPVAPTTAFPIGEKTDDPLAMYLMDIYSVSANLAGVPGISIPCGFDRQGLPVGLQLISAPFTEDALLGIAHQFQLRTEHHLAKPKPASTD
jgi:aspartyl-tRNA(Asn)/glutamyl-tRNA(Gln) amidotransferase subunit A